MAGRPTCIHAEATGVGKQVEHAAAAVQGLHALPVVPLVKEEPRFLALRLAGRDSNHPF
jgi:hypothetical protein